MSDEVKYQKHKNTREWIATILALITFGFSIFVSFTAKETVREVNNQLDLVQTQYQSIQNIINQQQTVDVIQARDNDVLIRTPDEKWIVVPMIEKEDIEFSSEIIEKKYAYDELDWNRIDLFNVDDEDWSERDAFTYTLPYLSINQNKMVSLQQFINKITIEFKYYHSNQIDYYSDFYELYTAGNEYKYLNVFENINTENSYVTNEFTGFNGIEDIKISLIIEFNIGGSVFSIPYTFDNFIPVNED
ncbi:hypothetical protein KHQ89_06645 [Mycoplasmatota bacterium]|nr:hypothetical protein KHQ89_06645 [Mycoplasmatota bacterium]